ncbi:hypothetical protein AVV30_gp026 [Vibrio phage phi 1]|uniref:Uncharacterized protein n=1 Tax=Vibrio phage phi 1 TaxID=1589297 RepID=A0A0B5HAE0_9CAUD|nr:hypothetical protein AVV30_gp026 [Vibrio phage phi 1]AJF40684.1 hypothetical protein SBVP1_0026 [Vibrio phage phi 1]
MKITKYNIHHFLDKIEYDYSTETLTFYTNINGYYLPVSIINISLEPTVVITTNIKQLDSLGITRDKLFEGVIRCKNLRGYS